MHGTLIYVSYLLILSTPAKNKQKIYILKKQNKICWGKSYYYFEFLHEETEDIAV